MKNNSDFLKLDFNERSDLDNPVAEQIDAGKILFEQPLWQYPLREPLETLIAEKNGLQAKQVLCTNGGDEAIYLLMRLLSESGKLILPLPAFSQYCWGIKSWSLTPTLIQPNLDFSIDLESTLGIVKKSKQAILVLTRPNNPTGEFISEADVRKLLEASKNSNGWVFLDEAYIEFSDCEKTSLKLLSEYSNLVILRTLSKAYGLAGIRFGYLLGSEKIINEFRKRCMPFNLSQPTLSIAKKALEKNRDEEIKSYCEKIIVNRKEVIQLIRKCSVSVIESEANFILLSLTNKRAKAVYSFLKRNNILIKHFEDPELSHCLRIGIPFELGELPRLLEQALCPKLICMDMDGVLIDTSQSYDNAVMETVFELSNQTIKLEQIIKLRQQGGYNNDWVLSQQILKELGFQIDLDTVIQKFQSIYLGKNGKGLVSNESALIGDSLNEKIRHSSRQQFSIVTGRPRPEAKAGAKLIGLDALPLMSLDDVIEGKPSPEGINKLQKQYSQSSWMCGDNPDDMQAAIASNSMAIGIGVDNRDALYQAGADIVLDSINEITGWLL